MHLGPWNSLEVAKLAASLLTPIVLIIVGIYIHKVTKRVDETFSRSDVLWRGELTFSQQQLAELYGPIYGLLKSHEKLYWLWFGQKIKETNSDVIRLLSMQAARIRELLVVKAHLIDGSVMPHSFRRFSTCTILFDLYVAKNQGYIPDHLQEDSAYPFAFNENIYRVTEALKARLATLNAKYATPLSSRFSPGIKINAVNSTPEPVAACEFQQKLILFWKADDTSNSIYFSPSFNGHTWSNGQKINPVDSTPKALAACAYLDKLFLFWKANDDSNAIYFSRSDDGLTWPIGQKINNVDSTPESLAACVFRDLLYLFWKANDDSNTIYFSTYDGVVRQVTSEDRLARAVAAVTAWCREHRNWLFREPASPPVLYDAGVTWANGQRINNVNSTPLSVAACSFNDDAFLFWKANDANSIYMIASPDGLSWPAGIKVNDVDYTPCAPASCVFGSTQLFLFWRADDDSHSIYFSTLCS